MKNIDIANKIKWVGKVDNRKVPFHRLILEKGTTYNSYLLMTEKPTVIDTVDIEFGKEYVENLKEVIDPESLAYIVINHVEPDHSGALPALASKAKNAVIVTSSKGEVLLKEMYHLYNREFLVVKDGDTLDIGGATLKFFETPYLHTEETMVTYAVEEKILFPCDIFSTHIANDVLFNDLANEPYEEDFKTYYDLIMSPHRPYVQDMIKKINNLDIRLIAPSHGYILRNNVKDFINKYDQWSRISSENKPRVALVYSSMTGNTAKIAKAMAQGLEKSGVEAAIINLKNVSEEEVLNTVTNADGLLVGSSTRYGDMVGKTESFLDALSEIPAKRPAAAFGSYGWSGEAIFHVENKLKKTGFNVVDSNYLISHRGVDTNLFPLRLRFATEDGLRLAEEAGRAFGEIVLTQ